MIKSVEKLWGYEEWLVNTDLYCAKILGLRYGYQSSLHYHKNKDETFYCLEGCIKLEHKDKIINLTTGQKRRILPGEKHRFASISHEAKILEVSTYHCDKDSYRIEKGKKIT